MSKDNIAQQYNNMVASIEDAKIYDGRGEYNLYECNKCNNYGGNYFTTYLPPKMGWIVWDKGQHGLTMSDGELAWSSFDKALRIITLNRCTIGERGGNIHRCQKPVKLYAEILRKNAKEGDKIFDSHLGSGSSRIAAYGLGFDFYATEIDEEYFEAQEERFHRECFGEIKTERGTLVQTNLFDK